MNKLIGLIVLMLIVAGCASTNKERAASNNDAQKHLQDGIAFASSGSLKKAVIELDLAIESCEKKYSEKNTKVFAARGQVETLYYMVLAYTLNMDAIAVDTTCSDALYFRGYSELDLGNIETAQSYIERAIEMSPNNSRYLSELGHIHQTNKKWKEALEVFITSEESAELYSPENVKVRELTRAKRGVGFALTELNRIDEAEKKYEECLALNPNDKGAAQELVYLKKLREKKS